MTDLPPGANRRAGHVMDNVEDCSASHSTLQQVSPTWAYVRPNWQRLDSVLDGILSGLARPSS